MLKKWMIPAFCGGMLLSLLTSCCGTSPHTASVEVSLSMSVISGPQAEDRARFRAIASRLETDGSNYTVFGSRYLLESIDQLGAQLFAMFTRMEEPPENFREILDKSMQAALLYRLSGIEDIEGFGTSSVRLSGKDESLLFRNRAFLMIKPESSGVFWRIIGDQNRPLSGSWSSLPASVDAASEIELRPGALLQMLKSTELLPPEMKSILGGELEEMLTGSAGTFRSASLQAEEGSKEALSGAHLTFSIPDTGGKLFEKVFKMSTILPGIEKSENRIVFPALLGEQAPEAKPVLLYADGQITIYSSLGAEKAFAAPGERLTDSLKFRELLKGLPENGIGYVYSRESYARFFNEIAGKMGSKFKVDPRLWAPLQFAVIQRETDGLLLTGKSSLDWNMTIVLHQLVVPAGIGAMLLSEHLGISDAQEDEPRPDTTAECTANMEKFRDALKAYATKHDGVFPAGENIEGIRTLLKENLLPLEATVCPGAAEEDTPARNAELFHFDNCSYLYFTGFNTKSNPKLPLIIDWPYNHDGAANVLFVDGTIEKLELDASNCRRLISNLQTIYHYNEKDFRLLLQQADKLDKLFGLN